MTNPSVDIIVPVWNNPFETRSCLAAILAYSPEARLIVVDNGSSRETELMLEEFSEPLGDHGLFMTCERNIGLVPSINRGLARSDSDYAIIIRPQVTVGKGWLSELLKPAVQQGTGIISPVFRGSAPPCIALPQNACSHTETFSISFAALLLNGTMHRLLGGFDEGMDGGELCLKDYIRRAEASGYHTCVTARPELLCSRETIFGSQERRQEQARMSRDTYLSRWGVARNYCLYFGKEAQSVNLDRAVESILASARQGNRFTLLLHRKQLKEFRKRGWDCLHTSISIKALPLFGTNSSLIRQVTALQTADPDLILVKGSDTANFPGNETAISFANIASCSQKEYASELIIEPLETL